MNLERNIQLIIEYDGTNYCGWQIQKNGISIQERLNEALRKVFQEDIVIIGSGRTDAGVHALGQSAHFRTRGRLPVDRIPYALNAKLPKDIRVVEAEERSLDFHSRYSAISKVYQYRIRNCEHDSALGFKYKAHIKVPLNIEKMKQGSRAFLGTHDFTGFSSSNSSTVDKVRTIFYSDVHVHGNEITYTVKGNGFLYNMVRIMVGTLIQVGKGKIQPDEIPSIIESRDRSNAGPTAPAHGLYLMKVLY